MTFVRVTFTLINTTFTHSPTAWFAAGSNTEIYKLKNGIRWKGGDHAHRAERTDNAEGQNGLKIATYIT
jgi:hypothetical protein